MSYPLKLAKSATIELLAKDNVEAEKWWREWAEAVCREERQRQDEIIYDLLNNSFSSK